jgi:NDP-hexose 4-ketoreductase
MRLLVIGANGFLGAHVCGRARAAGFEVVTAGRSVRPDSPCQRHVDLAKDAPGQIAALIGDVAPDAVVNCAGATTGELEALVGANVTGVFTLTRAIASAKTPPRLVHLGSAAEYGHVEPGIPVTERTAPRPKSLYGVTKLAGTEMVQLAAAAGLDAVVLRVFNPVGSHAPESSLPGRLATELRQALDHGTDVKLGPLDAVRDFVDARDVADSVIAAATAPTLPHRVLNIGSGRGVPVRAMVKRLVAISGCPALVREDSHGSPRTTEVPWQEADITNATQDLGWRPRRDLATSLADLWEATR